MEEVPLRDGWKRLDESDVSSMVAKGVEGYRCVGFRADATVGDEVLIWQGIPERVTDENGDMYERTAFDGYDQNDVPDGADYAVEVHPVTGVDQTRFAQNLTHARSVAREEIERLANDG